MKLHNKLASILRSPKFFRITLLIFLLQGTFFALAVNPSLQSSREDSTYLDRSIGLVPDGNRHMAAIYHFASQPILNGPFIHDMTDAELMMGDVVRFPSYLYYYLMSFPVRAAVAFDMSDLAIVYLVRFIGLGFGVAALIVFRRIVQEVRAGPAITNLATFALASTGAFAYFAPAENYDMLALLLWFCVVLASLRLVQRRDPAQLYWMVVVTLFLSVTKYTYLPFAGIVVLVALVLYVRDSKGLGDAWGHTQTQLAHTWQQLARWRQGALIALLLIGAGLFVERIGMNLLQYQSVSPNCARVHSRESCMNFTVYERNVNRIDAVAAGETWTKDFNAIGYTGAWLQRYYPTLYYYMGHIWVYDIWIMLWVSLGVVVTLVMSALIYLLVKRRAVLRSRAEWLLLGIVGLITAGQYGYNVMIFLKYSGQLYGHQGRYLLPMIGFLYVIMLLIVARAYYTLPQRYRKTAVTVLIIIGLATAVINGALLNFFIHANSPEWYSEMGKWLTPDTWYTGR